MLQKLYKQLPVDLTQQLRSVLDMYFLFVVAVVHNGAGFLLAYCAPVSGERVSNTDQLVLAFNFVSNVQDGPQLLCKINRKLFVQLIG
jgi:hypothetical protein